MLMRSLPIPAAMAWLTMLTAIASADPTDPALSEAQFKKSCGTCHVAAANAGPRQGPNLFGVIGRKAGRMEGFKYSSAFIAGEDNIVWDEATLDRWLTDPQSVIPGAVMPYKQADPLKRRLIIDYLKERR
jgi:cytochrome c